MLDKILWAAGGSFSHSKAVSEAAGSAVAAVVAAAVSSAVPAAVTRFSTWKVNRTRAKNPD